MKSVLVIGMGRFGRHLATKMQELGNEVMIVDHNAEIVNALASEFTNSYVGDCVNESVIRSLGVKQFDLCYVSIGEDFQSSLVITSLLKRAGAKCVVAKANTWPSSLARNTPMQRDLVLALLTSPSSLSI